MPVKLVKNGTYDTDDDSLQGSSSPTNGCEGDAHRESTLEGLNGSQSVSSDSRCAVFIGKINSNMSVAIVNICLLNISLSPKGIDQEVELEDDDGDQKVETEA